MSVSDTAAFTDPIFLASFGLSRITVLDYFLHPLNPFRTKIKTCNEVLAMQGISIGLIMQNGLGMRPGPIPLDQAEDEYRKQLERSVGEQYELLPPPPGDEHVLQSPLFTIRHVYRSSETKKSALGVYYVMEGVIYKSPSARSLMKSNVTRTCRGIYDACDVLSKCARYSPQTGSYWDFDSILFKTAASKLKETEKDNIVHLKSKSKRARRVVDNRRPGERTEEEEEANRAKEKMNSILLRLSKSV
jgi:hypothetical protein